MRRFLPVGLVLVASSSCLFAQGFTRPPGSQIPNTVVILQPLRPVGLVGPYVWSKTPLIGTGPYANRPWIATPWLIPTGTNITINPTTVYQAPPPPAPPVATEATVTIEFPQSDTSLTVNGVVEPVKRATYELRSPALIPGKTHTFRVQAAWTTNNQAYEWDKVYTVGPGEVIRVSVVGGFPVKAATPAKK